MFQSAPISITVVICAYTDERWDELCAAINSLQEQLLQPDEIILVIDHNQALYERARTTFRSITTIQNCEPRGLSGARNSALAIARGNIVAFMDEDAVAAPDWLARLAEAYADPAVIGVGGAIEPVWEAGRPPWFPEEFDWVVGCTYRGMPLRTTPVRNLIGCNMSFRREVFTTVGGFRSGIGRIGSNPVGCEETELCIRARQRWPQRQFIYEPRARVRHRVPIQRSQWAYFQARCTAEGLSKALVTRLVGAGDGLASERAYTLRTLPAGVLRGFGDLLTRGDVHGPRRAAAIVAGLVITALGYVRGCISRDVHLQRAPVVLPHR